MVGIEVQTVGLKEAIAAFAQAAAIAANPSGLMRQLGGTVEAFAEERYDTETDPDGSPWDDLSPRYRAYKQRRGYSTKKNQRTGAAKRSIKSRVYSDQVDVGSDLPYFERIQEERPVLPNKLPLPAQLAGSITRTTENQFQFLT
jgi:phage gpG-like protein